MKKRISALVLALGMVLTMGTNTFAATTLDTNGEQGVFTSKDTPTSIANKTLVLEKEIVAYNLDEKTIKAPTISYTYRISPATVAEGTTVTDSDKSGTIHDSGVTVKVPVKVGLGNPTIADNGVVAWTPSDEMNALTGGDSNKKDITIDFSSVIFKGAGVYRYVINETLTDNGTYAASGVTETKTGSNAGSHDRYIDVYVRPAANYTDGSTAAQWDIYGFTCFYNNTSIEESDKTTSAVKTTGFVNGTTDGSTPVSADSYYTFNVTVSKTVVNDGYGASTYAFPFTVILTNSTVTKNVDIIGKIEEATVTGWTDPALAALSAGTTKGIANIKSGGQIKYIGIPNGTSVEIYETNIASGVTYKVDTALTTDSTTTITDNAVVSGSAPTEAVAQAATKADKESTKATISTTPNADDDNDYTVAVTNTLLTISPTGVVLRIAPYALMLAAGIALFVIARKRRTAKKA